MSVLPDTIHNWTILKDKKMRINGGSCLLCRCNLCGFEKYVQRTTLRAGKNPICDCNPRMKNKIRPWTTDSNLLFLLCLQDKKLKTAKSIAKCMNRPVRLIEEKLREIENIKGQRVLNVAK